MKSKHLLLLLLMAVFAPWAAQAQEQQTITCYPPTQQYATGYTDGTDKTSGDMHCESAGGVRGWMKFDVSSIPTGATINSIKVYFYCTSTSNSYVKLTAAGELDPATASASNLFSAIGTESPNYYTSSYMSGFNSTGWKNFSLSDAAISNLQTNGLTNNYFTLGFYEYETYSGYKLYASGYEDDNKPYIVVTCTVPVSCPKPNDLTCTASTGNPAPSATFSWTNGGTETDWVLEYGLTSDFTGATSISISESDLVNGKYTISTGLTAETKHYARIKADCGGGEESNWSDVCEFTPTNAVTACEDFEGVTGTSYSTEGSMPEGWYSYTTATGNSIVKPHVCSGSNYNYYHSASQSLVFESGTNANNNSAYAVMPANTSGNDYVSLSFYTRVENTSYGTLQIGYVTAQTEAACNNFTPLASGTITSSNVLHLETIDVSSVPSDAFIAFKWQVTNNGSYYACGIDDVCLSTLPNPTPKPRNLAVSNVTNNSATAAWEAPNNATPTGYKYQYKADGEEWTTLTSTTALSAPLTGLTGNTNYTVQVQAIYSDGQSEFATKTFTTACDAYPIPYPYGFEDESDMDCWTMANIVSAGVADNDWAEDYLGIDDVARNGDNFFYFEYVAYTDDELPYQTIISPELSGITNGLHVVFYYRQYSSGAETFRVGYSTTDNNLDHFTWGSEIADATTEYKRFSANYPANTKYVAIQHTSDDQYYLFLDDFLFEESAACLEPTNVLVDNITTTGATISWTPGATETAWDIFMTDDATINPDENTTPTYANVDDNTDYPITGTQATTYYVYVRAICDEPSDWSVPAVFHTECEGMDLPYGPYGFEDGALSVCWNIVNTNTSYCGIEINTTATNAHDGSKSLDFYRGSNNGDLIAVLPEVDAAYSLSDYEFTFWVMGNGNPVMIGIMTDPDDAATFVQQGATITPTSTYTQYTVRFNEYTGNGKYVAIKNTRTATGHIYIDDIEVNHLPSCLETSDPMISNITNHTAKVDWTGTSAAYNVDYRTAACVAPILSEDFENETHYNNNWIVVNKSSANTPGRNSSAGHNSSYGFRFSSYSSATTYEEHLINKNELTGLTDGVIEFYYKMSNSGYTETFKVGYSSTDNETTSFTFGENHTATTSWQLFHEAIPTGTKYISIQYTTTGCYYYIYIDDIVIGNNVAAGSWLATPINVTTNTANLPGLLADTKYDVRVQGDCGSEGTSVWSGIVSFTTDIACPAPSSLTFSNEKSEKVDLSWTNGGSADWIVAYKLSTDTDFTEVDVATADVTIEGNTVTYTLTGLTPEMEYNVKVKDNCEASYTGDGTSDYSNTVTFTTLEDCGKPTGVAASNIGHYTADLTWTGDSPEFIVNYRTAAGIDPVLSEDFEDETHYNNNWIVVNKSSANTPGRNNSAGHNSSYGFRFSSYSSATTYEEHLINKNELTGLTDGVIEFYYKMSNSGYTETFKVGYSSTDNETTSFTFGENHTATTSWQLFHEAIPTGTKYISIQYTTTGCYYYIYIDDIVIGNVTNPGEWQTVSPNPTTTTANLTGLTAGQKYEVTVAPSCDNTQVSDIVDFTTVSADEKWFITEGNWGEASNWEPEGAPTISQNVTLKANATIESGCVAEAKSINGTGTGTNAKTLTIKDGGKLKHLNSSVRATVEKAIHGYNTNYDAENYNNGDYYLIANPLTSSVTPSEANGLLVNNYDLYNWDYSAYDENEWRNYEASFFTLSSGAYGYLYANDNGTTLTYTGTINAYTSNKSRYCSVPSYPDNYDFPGWYLLGNPYLYDAYLANSSSNGNALPYIKMNDTGDGFTNVAAGTPIEPMEGFFYQGVTGATSAYVVTSAPTVQSNAKLNMNLRSANKQLDNAILVFGGDQQLGKMTFRANSSKVYMPVEGKDYAITSVEGQVGEVPVNFVPEKNGNYSLSFTSQEVTFSYLHLIDNMTGEDVDLLQTPSYSFDARTTDYESRFRLVFATGSSVDGDNFAFINGAGNLSIFGIEGEATLQVMDINGRILSTETFSGSYEKHINAAAGIYMVRLINGNDVKVQKIVVR